MYVSRKVTLEIGDRIKYGDKDYYGHDYKECTRLMRNLYNKKFQLMKKQYETIEYYVPFVLDRYRYRGTEIFRSVKRNLKNYKRQAEKYNSIDSSFIIVLNSGWGELSLLTGADKARCNRHLGRERRRKVARFRHCSRECCQ